MKNYTRKEYEDYLNEFKADEIKACKDRSVLYPGSWLRRNDPIAFQVGYADYCREHGQY